MYCTGMLFSLYPTITTITLLSTCSIQPQFTPVIYKSTLRVLHILEHGWKRRGNISIWSSCFESKQCLRSTEVESVTHPVLLTELHSISVVAPLNVSGWFDDKWPVSLFHAAPRVLTASHCYKSWPPELLDGKQFMTVNIDQSPHNPLHSHLQLALSLIHSLLSLPNPSVCFHLPVVAVYL